VNFAGRQRGLGLLEEEIDATEQPGQLVARLLDRLADLGGQDGG
jgi:hypothetical protein